MFVCPVCEKELQNKNNAFICPTGHYEEKWYKEYNLDYKCVRIGKDEWCYPPDDLESAWLEEIDTDMKKSINYLRKGM